jgi:hypothetical protein
LRQTKILGRKKYSIIQIQTLEINFDFLGKGNFSLQLIKDGNNDKSFSSDIVKVKIGDTLKVDCLPRGGFVGILKMQNNLKMKPFGLPQDIRRILSHN